MGDNQIKVLLQIAGVPPSNKRATAWLGEAIKSARYDFQAAKKRPLPADHNAILIDIEKSATQLAKRLERLRRNPFPWRDFWRSRFFGPVHNDRVEVREVLSAVDKITKAARTAKDPRRGRRREIGKQHVVDHAFAFFVRFSPHRASGTETGSFAKFARNFYSAAIKVDPEGHGGLDRQIRQARRRLPIEQSRATKLTRKN